jgi:hypothetical protein
MVDAGVLRVVAKLRSGNTPSKTVAAESGRLLHVKVMLNLTTGAQVTLVGLVDHKAQLVLSTGVAHAVGPIRYR